MTGLRDLLDELAEDARPYDVTDRAVRVVQRRRTMVRLVPVAAALLLVVGLVATADGHQYRVDGLRVDGISPDGRWLMVLRDDGSRILRDLTGTTWLAFPEGDSTSGTRWSPDGRWLAVQTSHESATTNVVDTETVDLTTGARAKILLDHAGPDRVCAVRNSGELVLCPSSEAALSGLRLTDATGKVIRDIPAKNLGLRPTEAVLPALGTPMLGPDDHTLYIGTSDPATPDSTASPAAGAPHRFVVGFDIDAGRVTERYPLPVPRPAAQRSAANGGVEYGQPDARYLIGIHADGPLLLHVTPSRSDPFTAGPVSVELVARDTGALRTVMVASRPITLICYPG